MSAPTDRCVTVREWVAFCFVHSRRGSCADCRVYRIDSLGWTHWRATDGGWGSGPYVVVGFFNVEGRAHTGPYPRLTPGVE